MVAAGGGGAGRARRRAGERGDRRRAARGARGAHRRRSGPSGGRSVAVPAPPVRRPAPGGPPAVIVEAYLDLLLVERGAADNTLRSYRRDLRRYVEHLTAYGIELDAVT